MCYKIVSVRLNGKTLSRSGSSNSTFFLYSRSGTGSITFKNGLISHPNGTYPLNTTSVVFYLDNVQISANCSFSTSYKAYIIGGEYTFDVSIICANGYYCEYNSETSKYEVKSDIIINSNYKMRYGSYPNGTKPLGISKLDTFTIK